MGNVIRLLDGGWSDEEICAELGIEADELVRLNYVTGFAKLFENAEYPRAWETKRQTKIRMEYRQRQEREQA